jgi:4-hydroxythreonine-4-phosphate dehydrogenase
MSTRRPFIVTPGEPAGIGAEITLKSWHAGQRDICVIESPDRLADIAAKLGIPLFIRAITHPDQFTADDQTLHVIPIDWPVLPVFGSPDHRNGQIVIDSISIAAAFCRDGSAAGMVTNPIQKATLYAAGFAHPGHTEFLASLASVDRGGPMMMLASDELRVVPLTIHIPVKDVPHSISKQSIITTAQLLDASLKRFFGLSTPRIAIAGLNPHAGENGTIGHEDQDIIQPAITDLQQIGIKVTGPFPADTLFHHEARKSYDAVIGMYHDQVLIPLKTLDFFGGVNITLGLDFIRTSPDHGTGLNIAGTGTARPDSLMAAIDMARKMAAASLAVSS